jgi:hypothetical protein
LKRGRARQDWPHAPYRYGLTPPDRWGLFIPTPTFRTIKEAIIPNNIADTQDKKQEETTNPAVQNSQEESSPSQSPAPEMTLEEALAELEKPGKNAMRFKPPPRNGGSMRNRRN